MNKKLLEGIYKDSDNDNKYYCFGKLSEEKDAEYSCEYEIRVAGIELIDTLADLLKQKGNYVSCKYYLTDEKVEGTLEDLEEQYLQSILGVGDVDYNHNWSEYTGYLWTELDFTIGGHNLGDELLKAVHKGRYLYMTVEFHEKPKSNE